MIPTGEGFFKIKGKQNGKLLSVIGLSSQERTGIDIQDDHNNANQIWKLIPISDGFFKIKGKGSDYFLDVNNWSTHNGARLNIYRDNKNEGQGNVNQLHSAIHSGDAPTPVGLEREEDKTDTDQRLKRKRLKQKRQRLQRNNLRRTKLRLQQKPRSKKPLSSRDWEKSEAKLPT